MMMNIKAAQTRIQYTKERPTMTVHIMNNKRIIDTTPSVNRWKAMIKQIENNQQNTQ
jgi:hypothetical protein